MTAHRAETPRYRVYLSDVSYFSGKLEAALRAKRIPYERVPVTPARLLDELLPNTGWMKVPALRRDDGRWFCDTTPLLRWLDAEHLDRPLLPRGPYRAFLSALIEDYCDEWQWRPAMLWRWGWPDNARVLARRLGEELSRDSLQPAWVMGLYFRRRQQRIFLRGDGVRRHNRDAIAALYPQALSWLDALLDGRPYLLGARPSLVDIAWFGPMFRHYAEDPVPAALMRERAPRVYDWVQRVWHCGEADGARDWEAQDLEAFDHDAWDPIFQDIGSAYLPYLFDNAWAVAEGAPRFAGEYGGIHYPGLPAVRYRARCLNTLQQAYQALDGATQRRVDMRLRGFGIIEALQTLSPTPLLSVIDSAAARGLRAPGALQRLRFYLGGTPWDGAATPQTSLDSTE